MMRKLTLLFMLASGAGLFGCRAAPAGSATRSPEDPVRVVATTTILGDVVGAVGGDHIELTVLFPRGADVHRFDPTAADARAIADADIVFMVGLELDHFVEELIPEDDGGPQMVEVSDGIQAIEADAADDGHDHDHAGVDPHVWMDPNNVIVWVENIAGALAAIDPEHAGAYDSAAAVYIHSLIELDTWISAQVETLPEADRKLVTDHDSLGYFAVRYDFEVVGFIIPGFSTLSGSSAQELSELMDAIAEQDVEVIFVNPSFDPGLTETIAEDTGTRIVVLVSGALTSGGEADTYLKMMTYNVNAIVSGLGGAE